MAITDLEFEVSMKYLIRRWAAAGIDISDVSLIVRDMIDNPLPSQTTVATEVATKDEDEKQERITRLRNQLDRLEGR